jgi:hypothetical protein
MNRLKEWFRRKSARKSRAANRRVRPEMVALEERQVMSAIPHVEVSDVFLGSPWQNQGLAEFALYANTMGIVNSPYMDALQTAGYGVGRGKIDSYQTLGGVNLPAGSTITDAQIQTYLKSDIFLSALGYSAPGFTKLPPLDPNRLYVVFTPPNVTFTASYNGTTLSSHLGGNLAGWNNAFNFGNALVHYAVIPFPGGTNVSANGQGNIDAITESLSHEIAEATTGLQIADAVQTSLPRGQLHVRMSNGVAVQVVGRPNNYNVPIPVPGATPLPF